MARDYTIFNTARTASELYEAYLAFRRSVTPEYTNEGNADFGNVLAQALFGAVDYLHLRHDLETVQSFADKVERRDSARAILQAYGTDFTPRAASTANVLVRITGNSFPMSDITIDQYHTFYAPGVGKKFVVPEAGLVWNAGQSAKTFQVVQGEPRTESLGISGGGPHQIFVTQIDNILHYPGLETVVVRVDGVAWDVVYNFANSGPDSPHAMFQHLGAGRSRVIFGNNRLGLVPPEGSVITIECLTGGGADGRVGVGAINQMLSDISENGNSFSVVVTNVEAASGGADEQTIRDAMLVNPHWWRAQDRCGPGPDVAALARKVSGVLDATSVRVGITSVRTYVLAQSQMWYAGDALLGEVERYLQERAMETDDHSASRPAFVFVDSEFKVRLKKKAKWQVVGPAVEKAINDFFDLTVRKQNGEVLFGQPESTDGHRYLSDIIGIIEDIDGVSSVDVKKFTRVPTVRKEQWTGDAGVSTIVISNDTLDEEIRVTFLSPTQYIVVGEVSGELGIGTLGVMFRDPAGKVSFTITAGSSQMVAGDTARFVVSNLVDNVKLRFGEVAVKGQVTLGITN